MSLVVTKAGHVLGYHPAARFHQLRARLTPPSRVTIPEAVDLRQWYPGILDQGQEGACTAFGTCGVYEVCYGSINQRVIPVRRSRQFLYDVTRMAERTWPDDSGASMSDEFACGQADGLCSDTLDPYKANPADKPTDACYQDALKWRFPDPTMVPGDLSGMKQVLAQGRAIGISLGVTQAFEDTGSDGKIAVPGVLEGVLGGHGLCLLGYNAFGWIVANSWGTGWGDKGYCYLAYGWEGIMWERYTDVTDAAQWSFPTQAAA